MKLTSGSERPRLRYHPDAERFLFEALHHTQEKLSRPQPRDPDDDEAHITGVELLEGIRELSLKRFGLLTRTVFDHWGIQATEDFGRIVFELVERGEMRKTDRDSIADFTDVYNFDEAFNEQYEIETSQAFQN